MQAAKASIEDLAIFGGAPAFEQPLHVGRPNVGNRRRLRERIDDALDQRWLTNNGPYLREFEDRLAALMNVEHCVVVSSGMMALQLAIRASGIRGEAIVPSFTFVGTPHSLLWEGVTPVFCDVDPATHNIDPARVEELITPRTTAIVGVHLWGRACDIEALQRIADERGLALLFDAAHAVGSSHQGAMIGRFGVAETFSFHATKCVNSLEGGAVTTQDAALAHRLRLMRNFGFVDIDRVEGVGINGKMNEISAAMGLCSLEAMDEFVAANRRNYALYRESLASVPGIRVVEYDPNESSTYHFLVLEIDEAQFGMSRDRLRDVLWGENVLARRYFVPPCHRMEPYAEQFGDGRVLPATDALSRRVLSLPTGTATTPGDVHAVCDLIRFAGANAGAILARGSEAWATA